MSTIVPTRRSKQEGDTEDESMKREEVGEGETQGGRSAEQC